MPTALLLSPDDQAVGAISAVLEEMSVTCERPLDGVTAAQKLHSHTFDLVLVDCDNLPAAKLIFDVCRRGKGSNNPVPIAIVDGRAGLPTAFRLGAELILTKPVAKDQARSTIRTAVSRVKKEEPSQAAGQINPIKTNALQSSREQRALAVAAAESSLRTSVPAVLGMMAAPDTAAPSVAVESEPPKSSDHPVPMKLLKGKVAAEAKAQPPVPSSDPQSQSKQGESMKDQSEQEEKTQSPLIAVLVLLVAVAGLYASWVYEPGFRALAQPLTDRVLEIAGMAHQSHPPLPAPSPVKPAAQAGLIPANSVVSAQSPGLPTTNLSAAATTASTTSGVVPAGSPLSDGDKTGGSQNSVNRYPANQNNTGAKTTDAKPTAGSPSEAELPGEATAVVLSSKGADNRLMHSEQPSYPVGAGAHQVHGPMVLKAVIDENGKVAGARVIQGDTALAPAAISAVKQWRYKPYVRAGKAQPFQTVVVVDFQRP